MDYPETRKAIAEYRRARTYLFEEARDAIRRMQNCFLHDSPTPVEDAGHMSPSLIAWRINGGKSLHGPQARSQPDDKDPEGARHGERATPLTASSDV